MAKSAGLPPSGQNLTEGTQQNPAEFGPLGTDAGTKRQVLSTSRLADSAIHLDHAIVGHDDWRKNLITVLMLDIVVERAAAFDIYDTARCIQENVASLGWSGKLHPAAILQYDASIIRDGRGCRDSTIEQCHQYTAICGC